MTRITGTQQLQPLRMTSLLNIFQDHSVDGDTTASLLEVLAIADSSQWNDILLPFLPEAGVELACAALVAEPDVAARSMQVHAMLQAQRAVTCPNASAPLLRWATDGLGFCDGYSLARFSRCCKDAPALAAVPALWEPRVRAVCASWVLPCPEAEWQREFFALLRPRWDGVYVAPCGYTHRIRPGASMTDKRTSMWIDYRRYLRLFPPDEDGVLRALVLQDAGPLDLALEVLMGLDPKTHVAASRQGALSLGQHRNAPPLKEARVQLLGRTFAASYSFAEGQISLQYNSDNGEFKVTLKVGHKRARTFSEQLEWVEYTLTSPDSETMHFNLGRNCWGDPADPHCDHFPPFVLRHHRALEHLL